MRRSTARSRPHQEPAAEQGEPSRVNMKAHRVNKFVNQPTIIRRTNCGRAIGRNLAPPRFDVDALLPFARRRRGDSRISEKKCQG